MEEDLSIIGASFYENWNFARELHRMKHPKAKKQFEAAQQIRREWQEKKQRATAGQLTDKH